MGKKKHNDSKSNFLHEGQIQFHLVYKEVNESCLSEGIADTLVIQFSKNDTGFLCSA